MLTVLLRLRLLPTFNFDLAPAVPLRASADLLWATFQLARPKLKLPPRVSTAPLVRFNVADDPSSPLAALESPVLENVNVRLPSTVSTAVAWEPLARPSTPVKVIAVAPLLTVRLSLL